MFRQFQLHLSASATIFFLCATGAFATPITIPILSGTMTFSGSPKYFMSTPLGYTPAFNLVTANGTVSGITSATTDVMYMFNQRSPVTLDTSLSFVVANEFGVCCTGLLITTPAPFQIVNDGSCCGIAEGWLRPPSTITVSPGGQSTFVVPFLFDLWVDDFGVPSGGFEFVGGGTATLQFQTTGNSVSFLSATYNFAPAPEPATGIVCLFALLCGAVVSAVRHAGKSR